MARTKDEALHIRRREAILNAAAKVFKAKGFHLARTEDICTAAQMSAGTVFRYFKTKQAMIEAIAHIELEQSKADWQTLMSREGLQWLATLTEDGLKELLRPTAFDLGADSWLELARSDAGRHKLLAFDEHVRSTLCQELQHGQRAGWVRADLECMGASNLLLAMIAGLQFEGEIGASLDLQATARALADWVAHHILAEPNKAQQPSHQRRRTTP